MANDSIRSVDINSLDLEEDEVQFNPDLDATALPPPIPDGIYRAKALFQNNAPPNWQAKLNDQGKPTGIWPKAQVVFQVADGEHEGRILYTNDFIFVSTMVRRDGSAVIPTILHAMGLGDEVKQCRKHAELAQLFERAVEQGRELGVETEWEARMATGEKKAGKDGKEYDVYKTVRRGMKNFPQNGHGEYVPTLVIKDEQVTAQARIKSFKAL